MASSFGRKTVHQMTNRAYNRLKWVWQAWPSFDGHLSFARGQHWGSGILSNRILPPPEARSRRCHNTRWGTATRNSILGKPSYNSQQRHRSVYICSLITASIAASAGSFPWPKDTPFPVKLCVKIGHNLCQHPCPEHLWQIDGGACTIHSNSRHMHRCYLNIPVHSMLRFSRYDPAIELAWASQARAYLVRMHANKSNVNIAP